MGVEVLVQIDRLVQLLETPVFTPLRLCASLLLSYFKYLVCLGETLALCGTATV